MCQTSLINALKVPNEGIKKKKVTLKSLWQPECWIIQRGEGVGRQTRRFRNVQLLSMASFTESLSRAWCSSMIQFPHSAGQEENRTQSRRRLAENKEGREKFHTLMAAKLPPCQSRGLLEFPSYHTFCRHFKVSSHSIQASRVNHISKRCLLTVGKKHQQLHIFKWYSLLK